MNVFEAVKQSVTTRQAAEVYGFKVRRNGMMVCPFHNDKNPSLKVDRRFHCFGCGADGDVIDFTAKLYGIGLKEAAVKLAADFCIVYENRNRASPKKSIKVKLTQPKRYGQKERDSYYVLCDYLHLLYEWKEVYAPKSGVEEWNPLFLEALQQTSYVEHLVDILLSGEAEEKERIMKKHGREIKQIGERLSEFKTRKGKKSIADIDEHETDGKCSRSKGNIGMER